MICFVLAIDSQRFRKLFFFFQYMKQQKQQKDYIKTRKEERTKEQIFASHGFTQLMYLREMELRLSLENQKCRATDLKERNITLILSISVI